MQILVLSISQYVIQTTKSPPIKHNQQVQVSLQLTLSTFTMPRHYCGIMPAKNHYVS